MSIAHGAQDYVIRGTVKAVADASLLRDVQIQVEVGGVRKSVALTDPQGRFIVNIGELFGEKEAKRAEAALLIFSKSGFLEVRRLLPLRSEQNPALEIGLTASGGITTLDPTEKEKLKRYVSPTGTGPLFLIPYDLSEVQVGVSPERMNERLRKNLERVIVTHVQAGPGMKATGLLSVILLPVSSSTDIQGLRAIGKYLKALGMITGYGSIEPGGTAKKVLVSSTYIIIPHIEQMGGSVLYVDDAFPSELIASPRLWEELSKIWGRSTVLALAMREFNEFKQVEINRDRDLKKLKELRSYLQAERANAGPGNEQLLIQLNAFLHIIDEELAKK